MGDLEDIIPNLHTLLSRKDHSPEESCAINIDLIDAVRLQLSLVFDDALRLYYQTIEWHLENKKQSTFATTFLAQLRIRILSLIEDMDMLLDSDPNFRLDTWLLQAERLISSQVTDNGPAGGPRVIHLTQQAVVNAKHQLTLWSRNSGKGLDGYAAKAWSGLYSTFYKMRWDTFLTNINSNLLDASIVDPKQLSHSFGLLEMHRQSEAWAQDGHRLPKRESTTSTLRIVDNLLGLNASSSLSSLPSVRGWIAKQQWGQEWRKVSRLHTPTSHENDHRRHMNTAILRFRISSPEGIVFGTICRHLVNTCIAFSPQHKMLYVLAAKPGGGDVTSSLIDVLASDGANSNIWIADLLAVSYTHLRAHETPEHLVCRLLLEKKKKK
eukprot:TRINITY_DN22946_c0_g2_i1.p1 TRINITY_DN22946_c0_g2~~TRINITY_DN22946_c0_g2_i1.p1  ORF type:complete len:381 (-),score=22.69 TRINITY_DN22946_c0_g2_i1:113-1255(-)